MVIHHLTRATRHLLFYTLLLFSIALSSIRFVSSSIDQYKLSLAQRIGEQIGATVSIGQLRGTVRGFSPELVLRHITISPLSLTPNTNPAIALTELRLGIHLLNIIKQDNWLGSTWITLVGAKLTLKRQLDGRIVVMGLTPRDDNSAPTWLLQGRKYLFLQSDIDWLDEQQAAKTTHLGTVDLAIINDGQQHRINALLNHPSKNHLRLSLDFVGNPFAGDKINGKAYSEGSLNPALWTGFFNNPALQFNANGTADFKLWATVEQSKPVALTGDVHLQQLTIQATGQQKISLDELQTDLNWQQHTGQSQLNVTHLLLKTAGTQWQNQKFRLALSDDQQRIAFAAPQLDIAQWTGLVSRFTDSNWLSQARPKGALEHVLVKFDRRTEQGVIHADFRGVSVLPVGSQLGVDNISGQLHGNQQRGLIQLRTDNGQITAPDVFRAPLPLKTLHGDLVWQQTTDTWQLMSAQLKLNLPDLQTQTRLALTVPKNDSPIYLDLQTALSDTDVRKLATYFPVGVMGKDTVKWLDSSLLQGQVKNIGLLIQGNLVDFPFAQGQGTFEAQFDAQQLELLFNPDWPALHHLNGKVLFLRDDMFIDVEQGQSEQINLAQARITLPTLSHSQHLLVQGKLTGGILQSLHYMQHSPLKTRADAVLNAISPDGQTQIDLNLDIPLINNLPTHVDGVAHFDKARLQINALDLPVTGISGALHFSENGIDSKQLTAQTLGYAQHVAIGYDDKQTNIQVTGHTDISTLDQQFKLPLASFADGDSDYQLTLALPYHNEPTQLSMQTNLNGIALTLPDGLGKTKNQQTPLLISLPLPPSGLLPIHLAYDKQLKADALYNSVRHHFESVNALIGDGELKPNHDTGITLSIDRDNVLLDEWLALAAAQPTAHAGNTLSIRSINLRATHGVWQDHDLGRVSLAVKPQGQTWQGEINSGMATGTFNISTKDNNQAIDVTLSHLDLSAQQPRSTKTTTTAHNADLTAEQLPQLSLSSEKTRWRGVELGQLNFSSQPTPTGMAIRHLTLRGDTEKLQVTGDWRNTGGQNSTTLQGHLESTQVGNLLNKLAISKDFADTTGTLDFNATWQGAPQQFSPAKLFGHADLALKDGRILSIEPSFGRILGVLAVAQWTKRLQLDFSDLYAEGLSFDTINGHFAINQGKAVTHNLIIDAIPAMITITGETNFVNRSFNQQVKVVPKSAEALPIAGNIMNKLATVVTRTITGKNYDGFLFGSQYQVRGTWKNPQIIPNHENDGLVQKTWHVLTTFPWRNR